MRKAYAQAATERFLYRIAPDISAATRQSLRDEFLLCGIEGQIANKHKEEWMAMSKSEQRNLETLVSEAEPTKILQYIAAPSTEYERKPHHGTSPTRVRIMTDHADTVSRDTRNTAQRAISLTTYGLPTLFVIAASIPLGLVSVADLYLSTSTSHEAAQVLREHFQGWIKDAPSFFLNSGYALSALGSVGMAYRWKTGRRARCGLEDVLGDCDTPLIPNRSAHANKDALLTALGEIPQPAQFLLKHLDPVSLRDFLMSSREKRGDILNNNPPPRENIERYLFATHRVTPRNALRMSAELLAVQVDSWKDMPDHIKNATLVGPPPTPSLGAKLSERRTGVGMPALPSIGGNGLEAAGASIPGFAR